jgi:hypothetical protein
MNIQLITLLSTLIAVVSNLLSLNEKFSKFGIIGTVKTLSYYVLPIVFIQQILQLVYTLQLLLAIIFSNLPIILIICLIVKRVKGNSFKFKEELSIVLMFIAAFFFLIHAINLKCVFTEYSNDTNNFIQSLNCYKISDKMYTFLSKNLLYVFGLMIDAVSIILFTIVEIQTFQYFNCHYLNSSYCNDDEKPECANLIVYSLALLLTTSGLIHLAVQYIINLFE